VIRGEAGRVRESLFTAFAKIQRAIRDDRWKILVYPQINKTQLFDLANDPSEMKDLSADPAHAAELKRLTDLLAQRQREWGDSQPLTTDKPDSVEFDFSKVKKK
jgi:arylsulfatase A-like enzyme